MSNRNLSFPLLEKAVHRLVELSSATSTNAEIKKFLDYGDVVAVLTDHQTDGRGRLGRQWVTNPGESIALSLAFPWSGEDQERSGSWVPLLVGATLVRVLQRHGLGEASVKWPNDVLVGGKKLAGILCEWIPEGWMVVGVGLNVDFPADKPPSPRATALAHHVSVADGLVDSLLAELVAALGLGLDNLRTESPEAIAAAVSAVMSTLGRAVEVQEPSGESWRGKARGLDASGHLLVTPEGSSELRAVVASDIEHLYQ
ncbi:MAG: biotin--[acetyl-CoA-carboxylase] ligase [Pontimonas sp.]|nr:biotin--[acetyl-CoA-carboxylase] ligase [Pontimonas sp.]